MLLAIHVTVAVGLIGAVLTLVALGAFGLRGADPASVFPTAHMVDAWLVIPLALLTFATGVAQAVLGSWGLVQHRWVTVKLLSTGVATLMVALVLEPRLAVNAEAARGDALFVASEFLPLTLAPAVAVFVLCTNVVLGLFKPSLRRTDDRQEVSA